VLSGAKARDAGPGKFQTFSKEMQAIPTILLVVSSLFKGFHDACLDLRPLRQGTAPPAQGLASDRFGFKQRIATVP
jgi:hypothetical protein